MNARVVIDDAASLRALCEQIRASRGVAHKRDIDTVMQTLGAHPALASNGQPIAVGDDCAAIPDGDGYLLFAIEGFVNEFVEKEPWFAGYCGVMVNVSDIYAMGGRPLAVVDALWSRDGDAAQPVLQGMAEASRIYNVPVVGGHSNRRNDREQLSVAIVGRASKLLTSFDARPGEHLVAAIDLRGRFHEPHAYWDASTGSPAERLRGDLAVLPTIAEDGLACAAKDISMAGVVGTALMLLECSGVGATIDLDAIPRPSGVVLERWLQAFPSFGFLLSVADDKLATVQARFAARDIACASIGRIDDSHTVRLKQGDVHATVWDFRKEPLIGCGPALDVTS
ncbi:MAG: sll0787 family AIR synthase-like protein [Oxalicibacterium faecigallinarum]|uniref:sll0787 family AIR synthase-like protein n=1 Tax=Oxalicibacterium faecigallinarum TaxID=573741 RepID=UPI0028075F22|nr:sll0787 family AIR synthase-like protein [Oxalicibacterium faecigallinarum]MDQ7969061.1 sll0787 family AIR synthase-like protein [Oxalicibacterium faecigallinarum]